MTRKHAKSNRSLKAPAIPARHVGLARALSKLGYCSRSQAAAFVRAGRVAVDGKVRRDPETPVIIETDSISVDLQSVRPQRFVYLMMNKPRNVVTTASDEKGRTTVYDHLPAGLSWLSPVGRLDKASEGLLLLTNDTEWAARITAPESHLDKIYHVQIDAQADEALIGQIAAGVTSTGELLRAKRASIVRHGKLHSWIEIVLDQGRNRQIRRMLNQLSIGVLRLIRVAIGPLQLGDLAKGSCRPLTKGEKDQIDRLITGHG